jgi:uncharacterized protein YjbJ (UPF0337 family)
LLRVLIDSRVGVIPASSEHFKCIIEQGATPMGEIIDKVKGKIKQVAGKATGDKKLERQGKVDEVKGRVKGAVEEVKHGVKDVAKK